MSTQHMPSIHAYGYEGDAEEICRVEEIHRAKCEICDWTSEEHDEMDWRGAEEDAVEHVQEKHTVVCDVCNEEKIGQEYELEEFEQEHEEMHEGEERE